MVDFAAILAAVRIQDAIDSSAISAGQEVLFRAKMLLRLRSYVHERGCGAHISSMT